VESKLASDPPREKKRPKVKVKNKKIVKGTKQKKKQELRIQVIRVAQVILTNN